MIRVIQGVNLVQWYLLIYSMDAATVLPRSFNEVRETDSFDSFVVDDDDGLLAGQMIILCRPAPHRGPSGRHTRFPSNRVGPPRRGGCPGLNDAGSTGTSEKVGIDDSSPASRCIELTTQQRWARPLSGMVQLSSDDCMCAEGDCVVVVAIRRGCQV